MPSGTEGAMQAQQLCMNLAQGGAGGGGDGHHAPQEARQLLGHLVWHRHLLACTKRMFPSVPAVMLNKVDAELWS